jgi:hypothetical protein
MEVQLTTNAHGHILTNCGVWSPDGQWIVYDIRSDPAGSTFDGDRIERVHVETRKVEVLYQSQHGAKCGVATWSPIDDRIVLILGPENPSYEWSYAASRRQGIIVDTTNCAAAINLDARDLTPPFTPGALRGGTHLHTFNHDGSKVAFTYEDEFVKSQRNIGISLAALPVKVQGIHPRNHDGSHFSFLLTQTVSNPEPGSDQISRACEEAWLGTRNALAFQGTVRSNLGEPVVEVFTVEFSNDLKLSLPLQPLQGTLTTLPSLPSGTLQTRLTRTEHRKYPGIQGPRHWLRSSPDGKWIACLMRDDAGIVQLHVVSPLDGTIQPVTSNQHDISSAFTWSPDGRFIAHTMNHQVCITNVRTGETQPLTEQFSEEESPRPEACVFSPNGNQIAYVRPVIVGGSRWNQIFVCENSIKIFT